MALNVTESSWASWYHRQQPAQGRASVLWAPPEIGVVVPALLIPLYLS